MPYWQREFADPENNYEITSAQDSLIVSILSAGTFFGALFAAPVADKIGRRWGLFSSSAFVFNLGVILQTASSARAMFIAGRFFAGLGVGLISAMIPMYQSETSPKWIRGTIVGAYQLAITIGRSILARSASINPVTSDYRAIPCGHREQFNQKQGGLRLLQNPNCSSVRLVNHPLHGPPHPARNSTLPY
jgi:MFS family permease